MSSAASEEDQILSFLSQPLSSDPCACDFLLLLHSSSGSELTLSYLGLVWSGEIESLCNAHFGSKGAALNVQERQRVMCDFPALVKQELKNVSDLGGGFSPDFIADNADVAIPLLIADPFEAKLSIEILDKLIRSSSTNRAKIILALADQVARNWARQGSHFDRARVISDSQAANLECLIFHFAQPFLDVAFSKIAKVGLAELVRLRKGKAEGDVGCWGALGEVLGKETALCPMPASSASASTSASASAITSIPVPTPSSELASTSASASGSTPASSSSSAAAAAAATKQASDLTPASVQQEPNFISSIFILLISTLHISIHPQIALLSQLRRQHEQLSNESVRISAIPPPQSQRDELYLRRVKLELDKIKKLISDTTSSFTETRRGSILNFYVFVFAFLTRHIDSKQTHPNPPLSPDSFPLAAMPSEYWAAMPDWFLEDCLDYFLLLGERYPTFLSSSRKDLFVISLVSLLSTPSTVYIQKPYLKAKIVQVLYHLTYDKNSVLTDEINFNAVSISLLVDALMNFYVSAESTGGSSQFYDKFTIRHHISHLIQTITPNPMHRQRITNAVQDIMRFVRFANMLLNDTNYLLDEGLSSLRKIHDLEFEQESWANLNPEARASKESALKSAQSQAGFTLTYGSGSVRMLGEFTAQTTDPFVVPEIVERLAAIMNFHLKALVGPAGSKLKVKEPERYRFQSKTLLADVVQVYINLSTREEFIEAVAHDGRSYNSQMFRRALQIMQREVLKTATEIQALESFTDAVESAISHDVAEEDLGEIPDEYLDPLLYTVMLDPVTLPSSKTVIDRTTIKSHLLSDPSDPFNRQPLVIEDVLEHPSLKAEIHKFLTDRRQAANQEKLM